MGSKRLALCSMLAVGSALLGFAPAEAHHSFAMFDADQTVELAATVKELQWTNPHSWLQVMVRDASGQAVEWSLEMTAPSALVRQGWKPKIVKPGDEIKVRFHPLKSGSIGGQLISATLSTGQVLGGDAAPAPGQDATAR